MWEGEQTMNMYEAKKHIKEMYGPDIRPSKYTDIGKGVFILCILGFTLIPLEVFLKDVIISEFENDLIIKLQSFLKPGPQIFNTSKIIISLANWTMDLSETDTLRYIIYILYLSGDAILATKTALVGFFGHFILVMLKFTYKEPRPYWIK